MTRVMAVDYGTRRIGIALSDTLGITAFGFETISWNGKDDTFLLNRLREIISQKNVNRIVLGLPRRTDAMMGKSEESARKLGSLIADETGVEVIFWDERYTTVIASRYLVETGVAGARKKKIIDQVAAEVILREYLESCRGV